MSEFLSAAATNIGGPEDLVQRSAEARSAAGGGTVDEILAAWAGGAAPPAPTAPAAVEASPAAVSTPAPTAIETAPEPEALQAPVSTAAPVRQFLPTPETVNRREAMAFDQVTTVATAGLKERTSVRMPRWLVAIFAAIPIIAGGYLVVNSGGVDCGEAGQMGVDFAGQLQTCDQQAFVFTPGASANGGGVDLVAELQAGADLYQADCAACHTADGSAGVGPQLNGGAVLETWAACSGHVDWVALGSTGWPDPTYGSQAKPVGGGGQMPGFVPGLTKAEIIQIVLFERVTFGGQDLDEAGADCGYEVGGTDAVPGGETGGSIDAVAEFTAGKDLYTASCQACHNADGSAGVGPALSGGAVLETFPGCAPQVDWVALGSIDWPDPTYGAQDKPVNAGMPGFQASMSLDEIKQVVLYERVAFGGADLDEAAADCFSNET